MEDAGSVLRRVHADLIVSKQTIEKARGIEVVRMNRDQKNQTLCFSSRPFVLCGLPVRRLPSKQLLYERRNGHFVLQVAGHPEYGVPFGQDRIVPIFLATLAVQQKSQVIRFQSASEMLETFGMHKGGKEYRRLIAAFERIFGATMFFGTYALKPGAKVIHRSRFNFLREAKIWYNRDDSQTPHSVSFENVIVVSGEFYQEITSHPIPTDLDAVRVLSSAPAILDLFMCLSYRCFSAKREEGVPIFGPRGLLAQLGNVEYSRPRRFRQKLEESLDSIRAMWPECPARISDDGLRLIINRVTTVAPAC
jgi:Plasmid encoded RepA protein